MEMAGWKDQEGFSREHKMQSRQGARFQVWSLRSTGSLEVLIFPCWWDQVGLHAPDLAVRWEPTRECPGVLPTYRNLQLGSHHGSIQVSASDTGAACFKHGHRKIPITLPMATG